MGCHSWFARPLTDEETENLRQACIKDIQRFRNKDIDGYDDLFLHLIEESARTNKPFTDPALPKKKYYWFQFGWGEDYIKAIQRIPDEFSDDSLRANFGGVHVVPIYVYDTKRKTGEYKLYVDIKLHNVARLKFTYPKRIVHNKYELRKLLKKDYFKITESDHEKLSAFWKMFPEGIMFYG